MKDVEAIKNKLVFLEIQRKELLIIKLKELINKELVDNKEINYQYIINLMTYLVEFRDLNNYIKEIDIEINKLDKSQGWGAYLPGLTRIELNLCNIKEELKNTIRGLDDDLKKIFLFARVFITCFHETEHANQMKECIENNNTLETIILRNSMRYLSRKEWELELINKGYNAFEVPKIIKNQKDLEYYNDEFYLINPSEHLAEIKSSFMAICCFSKYFSKYSFLKRDLMYYFYNSLLEGYEKCSSPTKVFIEEYTKINELDKIEELSKELNKFEKALYGLELNRKEKEKLKQKRNFYYRGY